jgi:glutaredoxin
MALSLLKQQGVEARVVDAMGNRELRAWLRDVSGQRTVPQIFIHGRAIGGYMELLSLSRRGLLEELLDPRKTG